MAASDRDYIALYRTLVEKDLMLGGGENGLKQRDFEYLSDLIEKKAGIKLSLSTLKRLWKENFSQIPHPSTLDALVSVLDFSDWQEFKRANAEKGIQSQDKIASAGKKLLVPIFIIAGVVLLAAGFFIIQGFNRTGKKLLIPARVPFSADKTVTFGVPNTVMFRYDLSGVQADSFFIQQSWNPRDKTPIDPKKNYFSAIYYTPGFHWARLMVNDSIVSIAKVHIQTDGWFPFARYERLDRVPVYLDKTRLIADGRMRTTPEGLSAANIDLSKEFFVRYSNIRDFEGVNSSNFDLETRVKCDLSGGAAPACPFIDLMIVAEEDIFFVPLTSKGCVSDLRLKIGEVYKDGKDNDLSALGSDVYNWQTLRIANANKKATLFLNGEAVHEIAYQKDFGKIMGLVFTFTGTGSVDFVRLKNSKGEMVYGDEFETSAGN